MKRSGQRYILLFILLIGGLYMLTACNKDSFLDKKPNTQLVVPTTLADFQTLLDNEGVMQETPELGELSSDNYYLKSIFWQTLNAKYQNSYIWAQDIFAGQGQIPDWDNPYQQVFYANVVLAGLANVKMDESNAQQWKAEEGFAFFIRGYAFYNLSQVFAKVYDGTSASTDLGIPLRISPNINEKTTRASLQATYDQILSDLRQAANLLPDTVSTTHLNRPSRPAALALLARVCLSMRSYDVARSYADSCLQLYDSLIDYNTLSISSNIPIAELNPETLYQSVLNHTSSVLYGVFNSNCIVDSSLFASYDTSDLRRYIYYKVSSTTGLPSLKGSYNGHSYCFSGLAVDEVYLIRAECAARAGDTASALKDLNTLLQKRWKFGNFTPVTMFSRTMVLDTILAERRKELAFRGLRWTDLRRLNKEGAQITLTRNLNGQQYTLAPSSSRYILPIPPDVITLTGIQQNDRN